jgi:hypothetical protein
MFYDHDIISGSFGNVHLYDLTNYPYTNDPTTYKSKIKPNLDNIDFLFKQEIIGLKDSTEEN